MRRADNLTTSLTDCLEIWEPQPPGTLRACPGLSWDCFAFYPANERIQTSGLPRNFVWGVQQIQLRTENKEKGDLGAVAPLVRGSGGSCNLVQEISFHIVKFS